MDLDGRNAPPKPQPTPKPHQAIPPHSHPHAYTCYQGSIEERILRLQEKKRLVFDATVGGDAGALGRLTVDDLRFLFTQT